MKETEYRVNWKGSTQGHYVIAKSKRHAISIVSKLARFRGIPQHRFTARKWKVWDNGKVVWYAKNKNKK